MAEATSSSSLQPRCPHCDSKKKFVAINLLTGQVVDGQKQWSDGLNIIVVCCADCHRAVPATVFCVH